MKQLIFVGIRTGDKLTFRLNPAVARTFDPNRNERDEAGLRTSGFKSLGTIFTEIIETGEDVL